MLDEDAGTGEMPFSLAVIRVTRNDSEFEFKAVAEVLVFEALNGTLVLPADQNAPVEGM